MPEILENLPILLYDGTSDFICNWLSNYRVCENLQWPGLQNFTDQEWTSWKLSEGTYAGEFKYASNFTFLKVTSEYIYKYPHSFSFQKGHKTMLFSAAGLWSRPFGANGPAAFRA